MLRPKGLEALLLGELDMSNPDTVLLATTTEAPAAIYTWMVVAPGLAAEGIKLVADILGKPLYAGANLYARPTSRLGQDLSWNLGFKPVDGRADGLWRYIRLANRPAMLTVAA